MQSERNVPQWLTIENPGYLGKRKEQLYKDWDRTHGVGNWRLAWQLRDGTTLDFKEIFWKIYVPGYTSYFLNQPQEALWIAANSSYTYDKDLITKKEAFDELALFEKPGIPNQFHHAALNNAIYYYLGIEFAGETPLQVREGKPGTDPDSWPAGWKWSPGRIPTIWQDQIPPVDLSGWWKSGSIEDFYQKSKVLQIRTPEIFRRSIYG